MTPVTDAPAVIRTEDGVDLHPGDAAYDYYNMKPGRIPVSDFAYDAGANPQRDIWFRFIHDAGGSELLNGQRICTLKLAARRGFPGATKALFDQFVQRYNEQYAKRHAI